MLDAYLDYIQENYNVRDISLTDFDDSYWESLPSDKKEIFYNPKEIDIAKPDVIRKAKTILLMLPETEYSTIIPL